MVVGSAQRFSGAPRTMNNAKAIAYALPPS